VCSSDLLVGKTLATLGATFPDAVGWTYQLVGWGMYQKWDKVIITLQQINKGQQKPTMFREGVSFTFFYFLLEVTEVYGLHVFRNKHSEPVHTANVSRKF
jgi:hypothetical protein